MAALLWVLLLVGAWNVVSLLMRLLCGEPTTTYAWSIALGAWAGILLLQRP